jgi:hypothetical protein
MSQLFLLRWVEVRVTTAFRAPILFLNLSSMYEKNVMPKEQALNSQKGLFYPVSQQSLNEIADIFLCVCKVFRGKFRNDVLRGTFYYFLTSNSGFLAIRIQRLYSGIPIELSYLPQHLIVDSIDKSSK